MGVKESLAGINVGRLGYAAIGMGIAEGALGIAYREASKRHLFGSRLLDMQGPRWMIAEVYRKLVALRSLVSEAARESGGGWRVDPLKASIAKTLGADIAREAVWLAVQLQGGRGLARWGDAERLSRDSRVLDIGEGSRETLMDFIASRLLKSMEGGEW
jgi:alkylation response protein AidB-like acyl-CoA dehydrogenase